ncbi:hypothetical protein K402DRAFT_237258 [Aulographum hederae CBS 113979]|uniref:5'-3' exoribonuclease 1 SH3-like domain-containing protein n=1 Tax=Aulographum hederae CBS 113979 TaxID=1176131 RepID=A0A6G1GL18_9PEZI|nr:hypothetical protein K402DRAFT_237258 [Aulographum hederae CBS 113979]
MYVLDAGKVPIGQRGTVIGKTRTSRVTLLDVLFDVAFMGGTTLNDRCSPFRGSTVPITSVLNLSDRQVLVMSQAAAAHRPQNNFQPLTAGGAYGAPAYLSGQAQLVPAQAPGPLNGSFRGAVTGQHGRGGNSQGGYNGHGGALPIHGGSPGQNGFSRGRGGFANRPSGSAPPHMQNQPQAPNGHSNGFAPRRGGGRGGETQIGTRTFTPNSGPQNYSSVPPPSSLDRNGGPSNNGRHIFRGNDSGRRRGKGRARHIQ